MSKTRVHHYDFDQAWAERERVSVRVMGENHLLPGSIPATLVLRLQRLEASDRNPREDAGIGDLIDLLGTVFPPATVRAWVDEHQMDVEQMSELFEYVMSCWDKYDDEEGASDPPTGPTSSAI